MQEVEKYLTEPPTAALATKMPKAQLPEKLRSFIRRNVRKVGLAMAALLIFSLVFNVSFKAVFLVVLLIIAASFSTFYFNYVSVPVNFELVKLATILTSVSHGWLAGLAVGMAATFFGKVLIGRVDEKLPMSMAVIALLAVAASLLSGVSITLLGIALVLAYNMLMLVLSMMMGGDLAWNIPYEVSNFIFNLFIFTKIAPILLHLMR